MLRYEGWINEIKGTLRDLKNGNTISFILIYWHWYSSHPLDLLQCPQCHELAIEVLFPKVLRACMTQYSNGTRPILHTQSGSDSLLEAVI